MRGCCCMTQYCFQYATGALPGHCWCHWDVHKSSVGPKVGDSSASIHTLRAGVWGEVSFAKSLQGYSAAIINSEPNLVICSTLTQNHTVLLKIYLSFSYFH